MRKLHLGLIAFFIINLNVVDKTLKIKAQVQMFVKNTFKVYFNKKIIEIKKKDFLTLWLQYVLSFLFVVCLIKQHLFVFLF